MTLQFNLFRNQSLIHSIYYYYFQCLLKYGLCWHSFDVNKWNVNPDELAINGLLFGQEFRSPQDYGKRANPKNSNMSCLHIRRKCYGQNSRICSLLLKELTKNLWRNVPWKRWPLTLQLSRRSCTIITSRRIRSRTGTIFLRLNHTGRSSNNTNYQRKPKENPYRPRQMQEIRSTATTLGLASTRRQSKNGRRWSRILWTVASGRRLGIGRIDPSGGYLLMVWH